MSLNFSLKPVFKWTACLATASVFLLYPSARAQSLDLIGVTSLRNVSTNLNGSGIRVAQPEANLNGTNQPSYFEVNPGPAAGLPTNRFTYFSELGTASGFPNAVGFESSHGDSVGGLIYGVSAGVATNIAHVDNFDADYFINNYLFNSLALPGDSLVNQSFTFGALAVADQQSVDSTYDDYANTYGTFFISAACNSDINLYVCAPGTAYNCICVAAFYGNSSIGPTLDNGRCKPEITAPAVGTSFSTPQVAGAAAVLLQAALRGDGGSDTNAAADMRTLKALLINGAIKPLGWTNSRSTPLDARYGAGVLNVLNSYAQLAAGKQKSSVTNLVSLGAAHPPVTTTNLVFLNHGWSFNSISSSVSSDAVNHFFFNITNGIGTITLVWNRQLGQSNINDLDLFLFNAANSNLVACSTSRVDNVEHIYVPQLAAGRYDLQVLKNGGANVVSSAETYALAWDFIAPTLQLAKAGTNLNLTWPVYPAGFLVEAQTNLLGGAWSTNNLPPPFLTNGLNSIPLNTTNASQFFRLRRPNL